MDEESRVRRELLGLASELADRLWRLAGGWEPFARGSVGIPLVGCGDEVGARAAAGLGFAPAEVRARAVGEARGALEECFFRVRRALARGLVTGHECAELQVLMAELEARLAAVQLQVAASPGGGGVHAAAEGVSVSVVRAEGCLR